MTVSLNGAITAQPCRIFLRSSVFASCMWLCGCAGTGFLNLSADAPSFSNPAVSMQNAGDTIVVGKTSKADVMAALGPATVIQFNSGFEVWVYREKSRTAPEKKPEVVILFAPDGIVKKTRLRPGNAV